MQATKSQIKALDKIIRFASIVTLDGKARFQAKLNEFGDLSLSFDNMETKDLFAGSTWFSCVVGRKGGITQVYSTDTALWNEYK